MIAGLVLYVVTLSDGRCTSAEADSGYLASVVAALALGMGDLPADALVVEVSL